MNPIRLIIADADRKSRQSMETYLRAQPDIDIISVESNGLELIRAIDMLSPDTVLMESILPGADGFFVLEHINTLKTPPATIILTSICSDKIIETSLAQGAAYCMLKPCKPFIIHERIRYISRLHRAQNDSETKDVQAGNYHRLAVRFLDRLGISPVCSGRVFLLCAADLLNDDPSLIADLTKRLYPAIALHTHTTAANVEKTMRCSIHKSWDECVHLFAGYKIPFEAERATTGVFLHAFMDALHEENSAYIL